jgi:hypothetical protein
MDAALTMTSLMHRMVGAALFNRRIYEEVEADRGATGQAVAVVLLSSAGGGIAAAALGAQTITDALVGMVASLISWIAWATLTYLIGTHVLPEPQTRADTGELLRTLGFASAPGVLWVLAVIPIIGLPLYGIVWIWMLVTTVIAVRQALDYTSTARAVGVCIIGWALSFVLAAIIATLMAPDVS